MGEDVDDTDEAGDPADAQHPQPVVPGVLLQAPALLLVVPPDEVDSLQDVRHGVPEADGQVEQEDLEDDQLAEGGVEDNIVFKRVCAAGPLWDVDSVPAGAPPLHCLVNADLFLVGGARTDLISPVLILLHGIVRITLLVIFSQTE